MNYFSKFWLRLIVIFFSVNVNGQFNFREGSIITYQNDTLSGLIKDRGGIRNSKACQFKKDKNSELIKYYPVDIKSYRFAGDKAYSSQKLYTKNKYENFFFDILIEGNINLYYFPKYKSLCYFLQREGDSLIGLQNAYVNIGHPVTMRVPYQEEYNFEIQFYKDTLRKAFSDCEKIQNKIATTEYDHKSLMSTTKEYINLTCKGKECISYERDLRISKPTFGVFTGIQLSGVIFMDTEMASEIESDYTFSYPIGVFYTFPLSQLIERFSFQMELIFRNLSYNPKFIKFSNDIAYVNMESNTIGIPLLFKYEITRNKISPTIAFGKEFGLVFNSKFQYLYKQTDSNESGIYAGVDYLIHRQQKGGWFFDLGVLYKMHPKISIFSYARFQRNFNLIILEESSNTLSFNNVDNRNLGKKIMTESASFHVGLRF